MLVNFRNVLRMAVGRAAIASVSALAIAGIGAPSQVAAQDAEDIDGIEVEEIVVTGIRGSLKAALDAKRDAQSHVDVIVAEDIGKMPDKNIADSLQRVPGVTISAASANEGAFDENDRVSMRGTSPSFTQTLINGHGVASGDWFVLNQVGTVGRSVSYSLLPSELVEQVVVHKAYEAKLVEGGLTGSINIKTHGPLNFGEGLSFNANIGTVHSELAGETDPQLSALLNWKNDDATFGVMVQGFSQTRHLRRDGQEILGYNTIAPTEAAAVAFPELNGVLYPSLVGAALFEQERERTGGQVTLEFAPTDDFSFKFNAFSSTLEASNHNRNYMLWGATIIQGGAVPDAGFVVRDNTLVSANFSPVATQQYGIYDEISRPGAESSTEFFSADAEWDLNDRFTVRAQIGTSEGHGKTPFQDVAEWNTGLGTGAGWSLNGLAGADWNLGTTNTSQPGTAGTEFALGWIFGTQDIDTEDEEDWVQFDGELQMDSGLLTSIDFGVRTADHERGSDSVTAQGPACIDTSGAVVGFDWSQPTFCPVGSESPFDPANFPSTFSNYPGDFGSGIGGNFPRNAWFHSQSQLTAFNVFTNRDAVSRFFFSQAFNLEEKSSAGYVQLNFSGERWGGNFGLRYVRTEETVTNFFNTDPSDPDVDTSSAFGPFKPVVTENTYTDVLPTLNFRFDLTDEVDLRLSATRSLARPDFSALAGAVSLTPPAIAGGTGTGSGGNPDLAPIVSTNFDASIEWYFADRALLSASVFYMDIDDYVGLGLDTKSYIEFSQANPQGVLVDYVLTVPVNSSAEVQGFELAWQQPLAENFGAFANYAYADGDTSDPTPVLGLSKNTYNLGGYYETDRFSARVNYNYRSSFYSGLDRSTAFFQDDVESVDASFGYTVNEKLAVSFDARNLTDETIKYYAASKERPRSAYQNGRQYYLSLRYNY